MSKQNLFLILSWAIMAVLLASCRSADRTPTRPPATLTQHTAYPTLLDTSTPIPTASPLPSSTSTRKPTNQPTRTRTYTPTHQPTPTETRTPPLRPSSTPLPPPVWSGALGEPVVLDDFTGVWAPVADELVGIQSTAYYTGTLSLVSAPDFTVHPYTFEGADNAIEQMAWSPNGEAVLFGIPQSWVGILTIDTTSDVWVVNRDGSGAEKLDSGFRGLSFPFWLDKRTFIASGYSGGGHFAIAEIDYLAKKVILDDVVHVYSMGEPERNYIPVVSSIGSLVVQIITQTKQGNDPNYCLDTDCYTRVFYYKETNSLYKGRDAYFKDWQPGTHNALVQVTSGTENTQAFRIFLWNVDTDRITTMIPGGLHARYSPDGRSLLFTTIQPSSIYTASISGPLTVDWVPPEGDLYLQLMNINNRKVFLSLPVMTREKLRDLAYPDEFLTADYSPNGRYLAFVTIGPVTTDVNGWPVSVDTRNPDNVYLNILDLQTRRLLQSIPYGSPYLKVNWSPNSQYLFYVDSMENWNLVDLTRNIVIPIIYHGGEQPHWIDYTIDPINNLSWSMDSRYLSLFVRRPTNGDFTRRDVTTYIFDVKAALEKLP